MQFVRMKHFPAALQSWFARHSELSIRSIASEAGLSNSLLSQWRAGSRPITLDAVAKLLPVISQRSSETDAISLLQAYLHDETPESWRSKISIVFSEQTSKDAIAELAAKWEAKARVDARFHSMWVGMDGYMHGLDEQISGLQAGLQHSMDLTDEALTLARAVHAKDLSQCDTSQPPTQPSPPKVLNYADAAKDLPQRVAEDPPDGVSAALAQMEALDAAAKQPKAAKSKGSA